MIDKLLNNSRKKNIIILIFMFFVLFSSLTNSYINYQENKNTLYQSLDKILKNTALQYNSLLRDDFHDIAIEKDAISKEEDKENITKLSRYINTLDVIYGYTTIVQDGKLYFTTSSSTEEEIESGEATFYFDHYESADKALFDIIKQDTHIYLNIEDKWGSFRSINIPMETKKGNRYILSADIETSFINQKLNDYLYKIFLSQTIILLILVIIGIYFFKISRQEIKEIGEAKQGLEDEIDNKTKKLNASLKILGDNVISLKYDLQGIITYASPAFCHTSGYSSQEVIGRSCDRFSNGTILNLENQNVWSQEVQEYKKNGEEYWLQISIVPEYDKHKKIIGYTSIAHDITAQKARDAFMSNMSHELRTPLNSIMGFSSILSKKQTDTTHQDMSKKIYSSATSLLKIIDDILDLSKIKNASFTINPYEFYGYDAMIEFAQQLEGFTHTKSLSLHTNISESLKNSFFADLDRINQISLNLISNAIKFTPADGKVSFSVDYQDKHLSIQVSDNGIGMNKSTQDKVFKPFEQADGSITREYGGTGLGLSITQNLVELMEGKIELESAQGEGTTFTVTLPLSLSLHTVAKIKEQDIQTSKELSLSGHILIAEDNKTNQMLIQMLIEDFGLSCDLVNDGLEALEQYDESKHQLILMDENMPNMNGLEAMHMLQQKYKNRCAPIIALTANAMEGDKERFLKAGMDRYISKPIDENKLYNVLKEKLEVSPAK